MKAFVIALALTVALAAPSFAQAAPQAPPQPAPTTPAAPGQAAPPTPAPAPPPRFQDGLKYAYINIQQIAQESSEGKAANEKVRVLNEQKTKELNDKTQALQGDQKRLESSSNVMSDQARLELQSKIERQQREIQRFTEDAQEDIQRLTQQLQEDFQRKLNPVLDKVAREKQVHMIFSAQDSGLVWADPGMNLTGDVIRALDGSGGSTAKPAAPPAAQ